MRLDGVGAGAYLRDDLGETRIHRLECLHQVPDLVARTHFDMVVEITPGNGFGKRHRFVQWVRDRTNEPRCEQRQDHERDEHACDHRAARHRRGRLAVLDGTVRCGFDERAGFLHADFQRLECLLELRVTRLRGGDIRKCEPDDGFGRLDVSLQRHIALGQTLADPFVQRQLHVGGDILAEGGCTLRQAIAYLLRVHLFARRGLMPRQQCGKDGSLQSLMHHVAVHVVLLRSPARAHLVHHQVHLMLPPVAHCRDHQGKDKAHQREAPQFLPDRNRIEHFNSPI